MLSWQPEQITHTLCFLTRGDRVLMLHRRRPPNQGRWNGVGGRIEPGERPLAACLREVQEETGYHLPTARFAGLLTWAGFETGSGGVYLFTAPAPDGAPVSGAEGDLRWQTCGWVFTAPEVVTNIQHFGPAILKGAAPRQYHFVYQAGRIERSAELPLPAWVEEKYLGYVC